MTEAGNERNDLEATVADEVQFIVDAFAAAGRGKGEADNEGVRIGYVAAPDGGLDYMFAEGELLVREQYLDRVLEILGQPTETDLRENQPGRIRRVIAGVVLVTLGQPADGEEEFYLPHAVDAVNRELGSGIATPNHVLTVAGTAGGCPATEPESVYDKIEPYPSVCQNNDGAGVLIYMADTGLLANPAHGHPWLTGVRMGDAADLDPGDGQDPIPPYTAHGTFVAGVTRCMAPAADVIVTNAFAVAGSTLESDLVPRLVGALGLGVDIFHLTIAAPTKSDLPLIAFEAWLKLLRQYKGVVCVVAAGNSGSRRPSWPAAFSEVVSVGALGADWRGRATFSNFGGWVDVYAPGRDLINAYATGTYKCHVRPYKDDERKFYGMAKWSGTSFSTPIVTGLIAARMSRTGENGQQAAAALLAEAGAQAIPGVGAVLLPCCHGDHEASSPGCGCEGRRHSRHPGCHGPHPGC
ncbi:MAG: S8 family peptidase [Streptosporangiaceae bacterium]